MPLSEIGEVSTCKNQEEKTYSPVLVSESPVSKTPQRGNLTGNPRKIRDSAAELFNLVQEWNNYCVTGSEVLLKINSIKSSSTEHGNADGKSCYPEGLQDLCDQLEPIHQQLSECVQKMLVTQAEVGGVIKLEQLKNSSDTPLFLTWPVQRFGDTWSLIIGAYKMQLSLKTYIKENIAHTTVEDCRLFYIAAWIQQPYIESNIDIAVEALLKETGHR